MRIAWDLQAVTGPRPTGFGISVGFMLQAFKDHPQGFEVVGLRPNEANQALKGVGDRLAWEQWRLPNMLRREHRQSKLGLCYSPALGAPLRSPVPVVAHVNDLIPLLYPQSFAGIAGWYWKKLLPHSWKQCQAITVSNQTVADDLVRLLGYARDRVHIVPFYPDPALAKLAKQLQPGFAEISSGDAPDDPVFITLASLEPRKNIELAIQALGELKSRGTTARLLCIGGLTPHREYLRELAQKHSVAGQVEFTGYLEREQVVSHLLACTALVFVSRYEGYGLPPLEAMGLGTAVVLSEIACHRNVYLDNQRWAEVGAGLSDQPKLVPVDSVGELANEMARLVGDRRYRADLRRSGLAYSATFSPQDTAKGLCQAFQAVIDEA